MQIVLNNPPPIVAQSPATQFAAALPFDIASIKPLSFTKTETKRVEGFEQYRVSSDGTLFGSAGILKTIKRRYGVPQVRLRRNGKIFKRSIAKLVALAFIPNPHGHTKLIHLDKNCNNNSTENLRWVSEEDHYRHTKNLDENEPLLGPVRRRKRQPDWIDPERVPILGFPGYYITPSAVVYRKDFIVKQVVRKNKPPTVRLRLNGKPAKFAGLATLVADHFVPNPRCLSRIIFKDRNRLNCHYRNLAWVDNETWMVYCGTLKGGKKLRFTREQAIARTTDVHFLNYYKSLDPYWLQEAWKDIEAKIQLPDWPQLRSESYMYFIDRAERFSIFKNPLFVVLSYVRNLRKQIREEISPPIPVSVVKKYDESLRFLSSYD